MIAKRSCITKKSGQLKDRSLSLKVDLDLDIARADVGTLSFSSNSNDEGVESSMLEVTDGVLTGFDLGIDGYDSKTKLYEEGQLTEDRSLSMKRLDLDIARADVGTLSFSSNSNDEGVESSMLEVTDGVLTGFDLGIDGYDSKAKLYEEGQLTEDRSLSDEAPGSGYRSRGCGNSVL